MTNQVPVVLAAQAALFEDPQDLLAIPLEDLRARCFGLAKDGKGYMGQLKRLIGLACWAMRLRLPDGEYGTWVDDYAQLWGLRPRTLMEFRQHVESHERLPIAPGRRPGPQKGTSGDRPAESAGPAAGSRGTRQGVASARQALSAPPARGPAGERREVTPLFRERDMPPVRPVVPRPAPAAPPRAAARELDLLEGGASGGPLQTVYDAFAIVGDDDLRMTLARTAVEALARGGYL